MSLQRIFDELSADLRLKKDECVVSPGWAFIRETSRNSQVSTALTERNFHIDFWYQGVLYGSGGTSDLREAAEAALAAVRRERCFNTGTGGFSDDHGALRLLR